MTKAIIQLYTCYECMETKPRVADVPEALTPELVLEGSVQDGKAVTR